MKYRFFLCAFLAVGALCACGKNNPDKPTPDPPKELPDVILSQDFTKGLGAFTVQDKDKGGFSGKIWKYESGSNAKYGAQASASEGSGGTNRKAESWLVSPEIDLTDYNDANLYFDHAFAYVSKGAPKDYFSVKVSSDGGTSWSDREIPKWLVSHSYFELAQSGNIPLGAFKGKKIKIAFVYKSTTEVAPTWEIVNMTVAVTRQTPLPDDEGDQYTSIPAWMELPQVKDASAWHAHTTILRFDRVRDYSFSYNAPCLVSDWVAYPLYDQFTKNRVNRENSNWEKDPFVTAKQSNVSSGGSYEFSSKGYDRGHQIASADRSGGAMTNQHTFYTTNVTPQRQKFNQGIWNNLEMAVRDWSASSQGTDTLYVVTGCVADATCVTVKDHDGNAVAVPKAYYKALLRLSKGSYIGVGFYLEHKDYEDPDGYKECALSLKELEAKTGMTFFVNLPADVATTVKAAKPKDNKFWNL
ncbi:MAG: DNA/RNA non-specific endonuclease [Bacteroidales bacterium]|nr:DNA/RNA non-specific endonuclease [Bacteroidales bacterium]